MISVIVVYNDRSQFETMLRASLDRQRRPFELIALDNRQGRFPSAANALNAGAKRAHGQFLFFAHQDVRFASARWLEDAERVLRGVSDLGIAGLAGARGTNDNTERVILTNIEHPEPQPTGHRRFQEVQAVDTVDECAFFVPKQVFDRYGFDERTCDHWHLYAVDLSLTLRRDGLRAYALPLPLRHNSTGAIRRFMGFATFEPAYFRTLRKIIRKHRGRFDRLHTTCGSWSTRKSVLLQQIPPRMVGKAIGGWAATHLRRAITGRA